MEDLTRTLETAGTVLERGKVEVALRFLKDLIPVRVPVELGRQLRQRSILLLADCADSRADRQVGRLTSHAAEQVRGELCSRARDLLTDISRFVRQSPELLSSDSTRRALILHSQSLADAVDEGRAQNDRVSIFMSYRRDDSADIVGFISRKLIDEFGPNSIFRDIDSIPLGVDFKAFIVSSIARCQMCLVVIGPDWLKMCDARGQRRIHLANDIVRAEIETAIQLKVPVTPVLVRGAEIPASNELPSSIAELSKRNGLVVRPLPDFDADVQRLVEGVRGHVGRKAGLRLTPATAQLR